MSNLRQSRPTRGESGDRRVRDRAYWTKVAWIAAVVILFIVVLAWPSGSGDNSGLW